MIGYRKGGGARSILAVASGTAGGQLVALIMAPMLSRRYTPDDFGAYSVIAASAVILGSAITLGLHRAIAVPRDDGEAKDIVLAGFNVVFLVAAILLALFGFGRSSISNWLGIPGLATWLWMIPVIAFLAGLYALLNQLAVRARRFQTIAARNAIQPAAIAVTQVGLSLTTLLPGLVVGNAAGRVFGLVGLLRKSGLWRHVRRNRAHPRRFSTLLKRYWRFPVMEAPAALLNSLALQLAPILVAAKFTQEIAGQFGMAFTIVALPISLVGGAVAQVFLGTYAYGRHDNPSRSARLFVQTSRRLVGLAIPIGIAIALAGPYAFRWVLGEEWEMAGALARAMAIMVAARLVAAPLSVVLAVLQKQSTQLVLDVLRLLAAVLSLIGGPAVGLDITFTVLIYSCLQAALYVVSWVLSWRNVTRQVGSNER